MTDKELHEIKELCMELMEHLAFMAHWILNYCEKNDIRPPDLDRLSKDIGYARQLVERMNRKFPEP